MIKSIKCPDFPARLTPSESGKAIGSADPSAFTDASTALISCEGGIRTEDPRP